MNAPRKTSGCHRLLLASFCLLPVACTGQGAREPEAPVVQSTVSDAGTPRAAVAANPETGQAPRSQSAPRFTATAEIQVMPRPLFWLSAAHQEAAPQASLARAVQEFDLFRGMHQNLIKSRFVIDAALRDEKVRGLASVRRDGGADKVVAWLSKSLRVSFPDNSGVMQVSLTGSDPEESAALVNAVVRAYFKEVVEAEQTRRQARLKFLDRVCAEKEAETRDRRKEAGQLARRLAVSDEAGLALKQKAALEQLQASRKELASVRGETRRNLAELKVREASLENKVALDATEEEVDLLFQSDAMANQVFLPVLGQIKKLLVEQESRVPAPDAQVVEKLTRSLKTALDQLDSRRETLRQGARQRKQQALAAEIKRLKDKAEVLRQVMEECQKDVDRDAKEVEQLSELSVELEAMRADVRMGQQLLDTLSVEREKLRTENQEGPQVKILGDPQHPAQVSEQPDE